MESVHPLLLRNQLFWMVKRMKVIGLNASPKGKDSNTLRLVNAVLAGAKDEGAETELVDIYKLRIGYCTACGTCYAKGECTLLDDFPDLFDRMIECRRDCAWRSQLY